MEQKKREEFIERHTGTSKGYRLGNTDSSSQQNNESTTKKKSLRPSKCFLKVQLNLHNY